MFITSLIKRKLASALQPWLLQEPELELNLGFLRSHVIAKNLRFNVAALNETLEDSSSFSFTDFRIDQLKLRIVNWSASAFNWEVKGLYVTVCPRVVERRDLELSEVLMEEKKKVLREIDPEGSALHDIMGKLADISLSGSQTSSLSKLILNYCSLQLSDIKLQIHPSISDDSFECLWEITELNVDPRQVNPQSFPRGYINSLFVYSNDSYFDLEIRDLKTTLKTHDRITQLCFATDIITSLKMNDFQLTELRCSTEELGFSFSPADISTISVIIQELSRKSPPVRNRNGKQLWKETATKIRSLISTQRWSMWKLVAVVCLWLRYVHAWEDLFSLVGYPINIIIKRSALNMATNPSFSESFRRQWEVITEIEKELPAPGIALARRVVQCRNVKNVVPSENELPDRKQLRYFQNAWRLFCLIWTAICSVFNSIIHWMLLRNSISSDRNTKRTRVLLEDSCANLCYRLNFRKILITVSSDNTASDRKASHLDLLSFCLVFDAFIIIYNENTCENHLIFSCGSFKAISSSAIKGRKKPEILDSKTILWSNPARVFNQKGTEMVSLPLLGSLIKQMWSDWKISRVEFKNATDKNMENPFILCAIKRLLEDQGHIFKCCLAVGQLDLFLEYSSTFSLMLLFQQMQNVFSQREKGLKARTSSLTSRGDSPIRVWDYHSRIAEMEKLVAKVLPERLIQVGVYISGPQIRVSLRKDRSHSGITNLHEVVDDINLLFDCKNIELMMSPNLGFDFTLLNDEATERVHTNEIYKCQGQRVLDASLKVHGINAYLDDSPELQQSQIISLQPITIQLSTIRKDTWSLGDSISTFSALLHGDASGLSGLIYVDELFVLVEAVNGLMLSLSCAFKTVDSSSSITSHLSNIQETSHIRSENEMLVSTSTGKSLVIQSKLYILKISSEIRSVDLVIQKSRKVNAMGNEVTISESFTNQNLSVHFLPDNGIQISGQKILTSLSYEKKKGKMEGLAEFSGLQAVIFQYANDVMHRSHNICELSVTNCTFDLSMTHLPNELSSGSNISHTMEDPVSESTILDARISSSEFYLIGCSLKDVIVRKHQSSKLEMSLSVVQGCQTTGSCHCQSGIIFLETTSALMFSQFGNAYIRRIRHLLRGRPSLKENMPAENNSNITTWGIPDDFTMDLSQFYLALFANDESGRLHELLFGADTNLNLKVINTRKKMSFGLSQLSILSRVLKQSNKHQSSEVQIPLTSSSISSDQSLYLVRQDEIQSVATDARTSSSDSHQGSENYILKKLSCFLSAEEPVPRDTSDTSKSNEPWVGSGSISGFDVTVSLPEIQDAQRWIFRNLNHVEVINFSSNKNFW